MKTETTKPIRVYAKDYMILIEARQELARKRGRNISFADALRYLLKSLTQPGPNK